MSDLPYVQFDSPLEKQHALKHTITIFVPISKGREGTMMIAMYKIPLTTCSPRLKFWISILQFQPLANIHLYQLASQSYWRDCISQELQKLQWQRTARERRAYCLLSPSFKMTSQRKKQSSSGRVSATYTLQTYRSNTSPLVSLHTPRKGQVEDAEVTEPGAR